MAILANELRIGNVIWDDSRRKIKWVNHRVISDLASNNNPLPYSPIPLTPEILKKCGFVKGVFFKKECYVMEYLRPLESLPPSQIISLVKITRPNEYSFIIQHEENKMRVAITSAKHLHQLQNLYYALTGEELIYTP